MNQIRILKATIWKTAVAQYNNYIELKVIRVLSTCIVAYKRETRVTNNFEYMMQKSETDIGDRENIFKKKNSL